MITKQLDFPQTLIVLCTDLYLMYKFLVKLGTTKEKRLMIDIMALWQSYKHNEITVTNAYRPTGKAGPSGCVSIYARQREASGRCITCQESKELVINVVLISSRIATDV